MKITFLGTGTSCGVPEIGCHCPVCTSTDPRDKRLRSSALIETQGERILIDCGPDFRQQMLPLPFAPISGILLTHEHYDHMGGIDDLRPFCRFGSVTIWSEAYVNAAIRQRIPYCFAEHKYPGIPQINLKEVQAFQPLHIGKVEVLPLRVIHGKLPILGFRIEQMAYLTDCLTVPAETKAELRNIDTLIVSALRDKPHPTHQTLSEALALIEELQPRRAYLIHPSHEIGLHAAVQAKLPANVQLAYDGLEIEV